MIDLFITKFVLSIFAPAFLVIFFTRITFKPIIGLILTLSLITASIYAGFTHNWALYTADALSLTFGFWYAKRMVDKQQK